MLILSQFRIVVICYYYQMCPWTLSYQIISDMECQMLCWKLCITKISHQTNLCSCSGEMFQRALHCTKSTATMTVCLSGERKTRQRPEKLVQLETTPSTHWSPPASLNLEENIASQTGQPGVQVLLYRRWPQKQSKMLITDYTGAQSDQSERDFKSQECCLLTAVER